MGKLSNYLRTYRRRWQLTQEELAFLLGYETESIISRIEHQERTITLAVAYACQTIFGLEPSELFPALFENVEGRVVDRMHQLRDRLLQSKPTQKTLAKLELLQEALGRIAADSEQQEV